MYTVIHNYGNPYEKWNVFVAWPHLWLKLGMVKPEMMLCETVLNLSTLRYVIGLVRQWRPQISFLLRFGHKTARI